MYTSTQLVVHVLMCSYSTRTDSDELSDNDDALFFDALDRVFPETDGMFTVSPRATLRIT